MKKRHLAYRLFLLEIESAIKVQILYDTVVISFSAMILGKTMLPLILLSAISKV